jgi:hypothetical protein
VQITEDEADARLMLEAGLSLDEVSSLTVYWKRLLLGYKEQKIQQVNIMDRMKQYSRRFAVGAGGWRSPRG